MSFVGVDEVKRALVIDLDEERMQEAIDDAEDEILNFLQLGGSDLATAIDDALATSDSYAEQGGDDGNYRAVRRGVILLVQAYLDPGTPDEVDTRRKTSFEIVRPYRKRIGA